MIINIVDGRKHKFRWKNIEAIIEAVQHDNNLKKFPGSDNYDTPASEDWCGYEERVGISLQDAIIWASEFPHPVTLFIYEVGGGTGPGRGR